MSTKIYNGFKIKNLNLKDLNTFVKELSKLAYEKFLTEWNKDFSERCENLIDSLIIADSNKDFDKAQKILEQQNMLSKSTKKLANDVRYMKDISDMHHPDLLAEYKWTSINRLISDIKEENAYLGMRNPTIMDDYIHASIVLFPKSKNTCLMMTFSDDFTNCVYETLKDEKYSEFVNKYGLCDYHYQNQTDRPNNISSREWNQRSKDWNTLCPKAPSDSGIVIDLLDVEKFLNKVFWVKIEEFRVPEIRAKKKSFDILFDEYCKCNNVDLNSFGTVSRADKEFKKELKISNSIWANKQTKIISELENLLPVIDAEFIANNVLDLVPNFKAHLSKTEE